jgi:hypothetical protein
LAHEKVGLSFLEEQTTAKRQEAMETNIQLLRVIQEMQAEINKLEKENEALRMKLTSSSQRASGSGGESGDEREALCGQAPAGLHASVPTDSTPAMQEHQGTETL